MQEGSILFWSVIILVSSFESKAQEKEEEKFSPHHSLGIVLSHAHVFNGKDEDGDNKFLHMPAWGIDYNYYFHPKWGIGLHSDIILEEFKVEGDGNEVIERSFPIAPAIMGLYKLNNHWTMLFGAGAELSKEETFFLNRLAIEYAAVLRNEWEVFVSLGYDIKWRGYDSWLLGIGISKNFVHQELKA